MASEPVIRAAGAVLERGGLVAIVHRPRYDDWTLPKGKLDPGETDEQAALREVWEETGHHGRIERDLGTVSYQVEKGGERRGKVVRYFLMYDLGGEFGAHDEIDQLRWLAPADALELLSYERDREVLLRWARGRPPAADRG